MLPCNKDVKNGQANGTQATVEKAVLKSGKETQQVLLQNRIPVTAVSADQIACIILHHCNNCIQPKTFSIKPKMHTFKAKIPRPQLLQLKGDERDALKMKAMQVLLLINNATTGHKLQGSGVDCLFIHNWSHITNWVCVMLSHVKMLSGLHARQKLSKDLSKHAVPEALQRMVQAFRNKNANTLDQ